MISKKFEQQHPAEMIEVLTVTVTKLLSFALGRIFGVIVSDISRINLHVELCIRRDVHGGKVSILKEKHTRVREKERGENAQNSRTPPREREFYARNADYVVA